MKVKEITITHDEESRPILVVQQIKRQYLFFSRTVERRFLASSKLVGKFYNWLELPYKAIVPDSLSFQLDAWLEEGIRGPWTK